jgi:DNA-binding SARP family transcriptional activator
MQALASTGNSAEALRVYEQLRTLLRDEHGASPSAATVKLHSELLRERARV